MKSFKIYWEEKDILITILSLDAEDCDKTDSNAFITVDFNYDKTADVTEDEVAEYVEKFILAAIEKGVESVKTK